MIDPNQTTEQRRDVRIGWAMAAAAVVTAAALVAVAAAVGVPLVDHSARPKPSAAGRAFAFPTPSTTASTAAAAWASPAASVVDAVAGTSPATLLGTGAAATGPVDQSAFGTPFTRACGAVPPAAVGAVAATRSATLPGGYAATVSVEAYPAGLGGRAVQALRANLLQCSPSDTVAPVVGAGAGVGAETFTATSASSGDGVAWAVWNTGDVTAKVTVTGVAKAPNVGLARAVAARVDAVLREQLAGVCRSVDTSAQDASRNPFAAGYTGLTVPVTVHGPGAPGLPSVPAPSSPAPVATFTVPDAQPRPDLAPPQMPDGWVPGDGPVLLQDAPRGAAPVLVDPNEMSAPTPAVTTPPARPDAPSAPQELTTVQVRTVDVAGPGCGWAFTGMSVPVVDSAQLEAQKQARVQAAFVDMAQAASTYQVRMVGYERAVARWKVDAANYDVYQQYVAARADAVAQLAAAQRRYDDAVAALNPTPEPPASSSSPTTPVGTPTAQVTPTTPVGVPTAGPTQTPTQSPTQTPTQEPTP